MRPEAPPTSTARTTSRSASDNSRPLAPRSVANDRAGAVSAPIDFEACSKSRPQRCEARDGLTLAYLEVGQGRPFVLLHGYLMTAEGAWLWTGLAELAAPGRRVIMPDLRGHGASGTPHDPAAYPRDVLADDGFALLDQLGLEEYDLGGYSLGGVTVARMLARGVRPGRAVICGQRPRADRPFGGPRRPLPAPARSARQRRAGHLRGPYQRLHRPDRSSDPGRARPRPRPPQRHPGRRPGDGRGARPAALRRGRGRHPRVGRRPRRRLPERDGPPRPRRPRHRPPVPPVRRRAHRLPHRLKSPVET